MHDDTVDRTTTGTGTVSSLTFAEIRALGFDFVLCDDLVAMLPHFPTRFGDAKQAPKNPASPAGGTQLVAPAW